MQEKKYSIWFYAVLFLIPFAIIFFLEIVLRVFNYGDDFSTFVEIEEISTGQYFLNPDLPKKYFSSTTAVPSVIPDPFDIQKRENTIRIFVFGGSTTAGYPYSTNASFPRRIKRKLELVYPENKIEVINLGVSAVNTYFIYDILPDIINNEPDLLIFYTGHNEYYGALGPASSEYIGSNPTIVRALLYIREFKTYQLLSDFIGSMVGLFSSQNNAERGTLMKEMIKENEVYQNSELYENGVNQFRENMQSILALCSEKKIPVFVGKLFSNFRQAPLGNIESKANELFKNAESLLADGDTTKALIEFVKAKDADPLRFRAPEEFNIILEELKTKNDFELVDLVNGFEKRAEYSIPGFDLLIDHLHPNLEGYDLMADLFYKRINKYLKNNFDESDLPTEESIENYLKENFPFTRYDSTLAAIKIQVLLNDFPFQSKSTFDLKNYRLENFADTLAMRSVANGLGWAAAHLKLFDHYVEKREYDKAAEELFTLMEERPFYKSALEYAVPKLMRAGEYRAAKHILVRNHARYPDGFTFKNLGILNLNDGNTALAAKLLKDAAEFYPDDADIFYNLSRAYFILNNIDEAINAMEKCLTISPNYPNARQILARLQKMKNKSD